MKNGVTILIILAALFAGFMAKTLISHEVSQKQPKTISTGMDLETLNRLIREVGEVSSAQKQYWEFKIGNVAMACVADPSHDRMRIIAPIVPVSKLTEDHRRIMLEANFHSALDARYATGNGILYAAFIHPLSPLSKGEMRSALIQVAVLAQTFGTDYTSGILNFGSQGTEM